jgi:choline dehydrogenase
VRESSEYSSNAKERLVFDTSIKVVTQEVYASAEVILSAGTVASPQLLMLSGVGPGDHLKDLGIPIVHANSGVGDNLHDHCGPWLPFQVNVPTYNAEKSLLKQGLHGINWLLFGRGPATAPGCQATARIRTRPEEALPDAQLYFSPVGYEFTAYHRSIVR